MKFFKYLLLAALLHGYPSCSMGQTVDKTIEANYALGLNSETNLIKNPSAGKNRRYVTAVGLTITRDTSAGNKIDNKASWSIDSTAINDYQEFELIPTPDDLTSGNCGFAGIFKGDGRLYKAQILDGSGNVLAQTVTLTNETGWREFKVWHPCGASGARKVRITQTESGTAPAINVGKLFYGRMEPGSGVPPDKFTARFSSAGIITGSTGSVNWIGNCVVTDTSLFTCPLTNFTSTPNCIVQGNTSADPVTAMITYSIVESASNAAQLQFRTLSGGTKANLVGVISCTKTGSDYIQPAITPAQWDYDWTNYTQAVVAETGTFPTYTLNVMQQARFAGKLYLKGKLTMTGTNTWSDMRIPVPTGLQILTSVIAPGEISYLDVGSNFYAGSIISMNASYIRIGSKSGTNGQGLVVNQTTPFTWVSGDTVEWFIGPLDVAGWTTSGAAPQLVGSVTSNATYAVRDEYVSMVNTGCSTTPCSIDRQTTGFVASTGWTRSGTGTYSIAFQVPFASPGPVCTCTAYRVTGGNTGECLAATPTTTSVTIQTANPSTATPADSTDVVSVFCKGPR